MKKLGYLIFATMLAVGFTSCEDSDPVVEQGTTGQFIWQLTENGTLTISGNEELLKQNKGFILSSSNAPWDAYREEIRAIVIGKGISGIYAESFIDYPSLTKATFSDDLTYIGRRAFAGCSSLKSVESLEGDVFYGCSALEKIEVAAENSEYLSKDGILFTKSGATLICCPAGKSVGHYTIPDNVTKISDYAFTSCSALTGITIPEGMKEIGNGAFAWCTGLTEISIPVGVKRIENVTFYGCTGLTDVTLSYTVTTIGAEAFAYCSSLTTITCLAIAPPILSSNTFYGAFAIFERLLLYVRSAYYIDIYRADEAWSALFSTIEVVPAE